MRRRTTSRSVHATYRATQSLISNQKVTVFSPSGDFLVAAGTKDVSNYCAPLHVY